MTTAVAVVTTITTTDCAVCSTGYSRSSAYQCSECATGYKAGAVALLAALAAILAFVLLYVISDLVDIGGAGDAVGAGRSGTSAVPQCGMMCHSLSFLPWQSLRVPLVVFQILTQYISISGLRLPELYMKFLAWVDILNLNLGVMLNFACVVELSFYDRLLLNTLAPFAVLLLLKVTYSVVQYKEKSRATTAAAAAGSSDSSSDNNNNSNTGSATTARLSFGEQLAARLQRALTKHHTVFLVTTFLVYSTVSTVVFQTFACDVIQPTGESYLRADYSVSCQTREHHWYQVYAGIMVSVQARTFKQ
jgi:hypothetical protein